MLDSRHALALAAFAMGLFAAGAARAQTFPAKFRTELAGAGFVGPVAVAFLPNGRMLVAEQGGLVWVVDSGATLPAPFVDLSGEVGASGDRGLLGLAVSPDFALTGEVFFLFTVDPTPGDGAEPDYDSASWSRLVRYEADLAGGGLAVDPATRAVLVGNDASDGIASCSPSHSIGTVKYALDGTLFVGAGDGADFRYADGGQVPNASAPTCADLFPGENVGALRSQDLNVLAGKILRLDPATGGGPPDNPFFDGDPTSAASRAWALGFRNPYRFTVRPGGTGPGVVYAGDVGWTTWEELDVVHAGENHGWPCFEGPGPQPDYLAEPSTAGVCASLAAAAVTAPLVAWHHSDPLALGFTGQTALGGAFYEGTSYPAIYQGALFFGDYSEGWIRVARLDSLDGLVELLDFAGGLDLPVDIEADPATGDIVYVALAAGEVRRIVYDDPNPGNEPPVARIAATPTAGDAPLEVALSGAGSTDPDGDPLVHAWTFDDGGPPLAGADVTHTFESPGTYTATLTVTDPSGAAGTAVRAIQVGGGGCRCRAVAGPGGAAPPSAWAAALVVLSLMARKRRSR